MSAWSRIPPEFSQDGNLFKDESKSPTVFTFSVSQTCRVIYSIYDVTGEKICTLVDDTLSADIYRFVWDGLSCDLSEPVPTIAGAYRAAFEAWDLDTNELLHTDEVVAVLYPGDPEQTILGYANKDGKFSTTWKQFFPHLYDWEPFIATDEQANPMGTFSYLDLVRITLTDTSAHLSQYIDVVVKDGPNSFTLTWNPGKVHSWQSNIDMKQINSHSITRTSKQTSGQSTIQVPISVNTKSDPPPPPPFTVHQNYPNPFN